PETLIDFETQVPRHERFGSLEIEYIHFRDAQTPHLQHVPEAEGCHQSGASAASLEDRIRGDCRGVNDRLEIVRPQSVSSKNLSYSSDDAAAVILRCRRYLLCQYGPIPTDENEVGKGSTHIDAEAIFWSRRHNDPIY